MKFTKEQPLDEAMGNVARKQLLDWLLTNLWANNSFSSSPFTPHPQQHSIPAGAPSTIRPVNCTLHDCIFQYIWAVGLCKYRVSNKLGKNVNKKTFFKLCHCFLGQIYPRQGRGMHPISRTGDTVLDLCLDLTLGYFLSTQDTGI